MRQIALSFFSECVHYSQSFFLLVRSSHVSYVPFSRLVLFAPASDTFDTQHTHIYTYLYMCKLKAVTSVLTVLFFSIFFFFVFKAVLLLNVRGRCKKQKQKQKTTTTFKKKSEDDAVDRRMRDSLGALCVSSDCLPYDIVRNPKALSPVFFYVFSGFFGGVKLRRREKEKKVDFPTSLLSPFSPSICVLFNYCSLS